MRLFRRVAVLTATLGVAIAAASSTGAASAATGPTSPNTPGPHTYTYSTTTSGSTTSTGTLAWNNTTWALTITAKTGQLAAGSCVTAYFDWRASGHHDARAVRDCKSNDTYSYSFTDSNPSNLLGGPSRMGLCYGTDDTIGTCTYYNITTTPYIPMDWTPWPQSSRSNPCSLSWTKRAADGTTSTFIDPRPQRDAAGTC